MPVKTQTQASPIVVDVKASKTQAQPRTRQRYWNGKQSSIPSASAKLSAWLDAIVSTLIGSLIHPSEPVIHYECDQRGEIWRVYDPETQREAVFFNENEVRVWLERRYH
ncbi:hypothetical protein HJG54_06155 [Leptolyngbya sp. NK1-12]|uniref:Uncharacterized protein n=1 Tax=Leptolyngbya sp. NK1-12 TaxID=2547451 RepID=A0AA97AEV7_9CYAN|nr:hypothetical protein [Leptolyngbya sp. NK1-12]WNZ22485.1 hypothetical protein HJG54_06155 [Leptolyngbya sp. NK1-12]